MKVQLKDIILAVPALSKLSAGDLQLRLAYKLKRIDFRCCRRKRTSLPNSGRRSLKNTVRRKEDGTFAFRR